MNRCAFVFKTSLILYFLTFLLGNHLQAQKNNAVADDATTLVRLLRKDYSTIDDVNLKKDLLIKDRKQAITILKEYVVTKSLNINLDTNQGSIHYPKKVARLSNAKTDVKLTNDKIELIKKDPGSAATLVGSGITIGELQDRVKDSLESISKLEFLIDDFHFQQLITTYSSTNPYLEKIAKAFQSKYDAIHNHKVDTLTSSIGRTTIEKSLPFLGGGGLSFEEGIDGLARFLAKRLKEELATQIFSKIKKKLNNPDSINDKFLELKLMLPATVDFMAKLDEVELSGLMDALKENIKKDLDNLVVNLPSLEKSPRIRKLIKENENLRLTIQGLKLMKALSDTNHPLDYVDVIANSSIVADWSDPDNTPLERYNVAQGIKLTSLLVNSFTVKQPEGRNWIHLEYWKSHAKDLHFYQIFFGMLMHQNNTYYNINLNGSSLHDLLDNSFEDLNKFEKFQEKLEPAINRFLMSAEKLNNKITSIKQLKRQGAKIKGDTLFAYVNDILSLLEEGISSTETLIELLSRRNVNISEKFEPYFKYANMSNEVMLHLSKREFTKALTMSIGVYQELKNPGDSAVTLDVVNQVRLLLDKIKGNEEIIALKNIAAAIASSPQTSIRSKDINVLKKALTRTMVEHYHEKNLTDIIANSPIHQGTSNYQSIETVIDWFENGFNNSQYTHNEWKSVAKVAHLINDEATITSNDLKPLIKLLSEAKNKDLNQLFRLYEKIENISSTVASGSAGYSDTEAIMTDLLTNAEAQARMLATDKLRILTQELLDKIDKEIGNKKSELKKENMKDIREAIQSISDSFEVFLKDYDADNLEKNIKIFLKNLSSDLMTTLYHHFINEKLSDKSREEVVKYVNFIIAIAKAENAEDAEAAITALALPAGSSTIKRTNPSNISLNSYPGLLMALDNQLNVAGKADFSPSFTAPVGIAFSWNTKKKRSNSIYLTIIDIGALTALRIDSNDEPLPEFTFKNILAPGAYYIYGFKNSPLSLGAGMQYGPNSRVSASGSIVKTVRYGISLTVDIPLLNFYTKTK